MSKLDVLSLGVGVFLSIFVTGVWNVVFFFSQGKTAEMFGALWATIITVIVTIPYLIYFFSVLKKVNKSKPDSKKANT